MYIHASCTVVHVYTCIRVLWYMYIHAYMYSGACIYMYTCTVVHVYTCIHVQWCMYICTVYVLENVTIIAKLYN